jgi:hypothetical protein
MKRKPETDEQREQRQLQQEIIEIINESLEPYNDKHDADGDLLYTKQITYDDNSLKYRININGNITINIGSQHRTSIVSQRIDIKTKKLEEYIKAILLCLDILLESQNRKVNPHTNEDGSITFYIIKNEDDSVQNLEDLLTYFKVGVGPIPKATVKIKGTKNAASSDFRPEHFKKIKQIKSLDIPSNYLYISWVNGEEGGVKLLGIISLFIGFLNFILLNPSIHFATLEDVSNTHAVYQLFGFMHLDQANPYTASSDLTSFERIIDQVTELICRVYPSSCECFAEAKIQFKQSATTEFTAGKRRPKKRTKRRKSKRKSNRRKTKRRRKY